ncbi:hypothetical protein [Actinomadura sp. 3N508]|uniref:hypothetical protein n=1 Tax=Actinomadura sp. 3N508 TaxID=3375153 RepID=UPI00378FABF9
MNDLAVVSVADLAVWTALVVVMTVTLIGLCWSAVRLRREATCTRLPAYHTPATAIEEMAGHPEGPGTLPDPVEERAFGAIADRLLQDADLAAALHDLGWHE